MAAKRKVVIIGSAWPLRGGGISTFNERLAKAYIDSGCDTIIYSFSLQYPALFFPGTSQYTNEPPPQGLNIKVKINSINPLNWIGVGNEVRKSRPDLVIVRFWIPFMAPSLGTICRLIRKKGIPVVAIVDNIIPHEKKFFDRVLAKYFVESVDYFITMSKAVLNDLKNFDNKKPKKLTVHPLYDNFGDSISKKQALEKLQLDNAFHYILFFGFIREYKGLDILIEALSDKKLYKFPLKLLVVGEFYSDPKAYHDLVEKYQLQEKIIFFSDFVPNSEVVNYFCASSIVVQPYKDATQSGITQVAYHFNKPMITTNVGGLSEMIKDNVVGFVVEPKSSEVADAIFTYFNQNLEKTFSENVSHEKLRFSWDTMIQAIDEVIA